MLAPDVDARLRAAGLSPAPKPFQQFFPVSAPALECPWGEQGNYDAIFYYAWAALAPGGRAAVIAAALENGYVAEESTDGTWVTNPTPAGPPESPILVTEEWVAFAPSREQIHDILLTR